MSYDTVNEELVAAIDKLAEGERDVLHLCNEEGIVTAADVAFQLAYPNARSRNDCARAAGILLRLEKLGAVKRDRRRTDTVRVVRRPFHNPPVVYQINNDWQDALEAWTGREAVKARAQRRPRTPSAEAPLPIP